MRTISSSYNLIIFIITKKELIKIIQNNFKGKIRENSFFKSTYS